MANRFIARSYGLLALVLLMGAGVAGADESKKNFRLYCIGCHQMDGRGTPAKGIPDLRAEIGLYLQTPGGRAYIAHVPGALNTPLDDAQTANLLNWVVHNIARTGVPADFRPYTAEDVAAYRKTVPADILAERAELQASLANAKP